VPADAVNMELRRRLWDGQLPIKVDLSLSDTASIDRPRSLYVNIHYKLMQTNRLWHQERITFSIF
jgi:hypothetical protein